MLCFLLALALALALCVPAATQASDRTLKTALAKWSHRIAVEARGIGLSAVHRHPRRLMYRARRFRADALSARRGIAAQRASSARGRRARAFALAAFGDYAVVGREWALSAQARLRGQKGLAVRHASAAKRFAVKGDRLLVAAGKALR